jgi:phenylalanyl-tRNA synthetase beta chain
MKISYNWLKDYINLNTAPEKLPEILTMAGLAAESVNKLADDFIFEIEVTANRPDWLSYIGVARELSAITGAKLRVPVASGFPAHGATGGAGRGQDSGYSKKSKIKITVDEKTLCSRYTARVIRDVKISDSCESLKKKLASQGARSVNNVVDITNFCLFETGEPLHAFDLDKIDGEIIIRKARKGEKIVTIDGVERALEDSMLVIADRSKAIAIAGVMGALNTEVTSSTKNILLEAAYFDQISIRRTARVLGISTDSSYRFERKVDLNNVGYSSDRATNLICEMASGKPAEFIDIGKKSTASSTITLRLAKLDSLLGLEIPSAKVKKIITSLGLKIKKASKDKIIMDAPPFRYDLNSEVDIIEEVARIYGYNKIPSTIPPLVEQDGKIPHEIVVEKNIRRTLSAFGADEIMTYSPISGNCLKMARLDDRPAAQIKNPLSVEQEMMRPSLLPGMLSSMLWNINRKAMDLKFFELGKIYAKKAETKFSEEKYLSVAITGTTSSWTEGERPYDFFDLKGAIESILSELGIEGAAFERSQNNIYARSCAASIKIGGEEIGTAGEVAADILKNFDIKEHVYFCEIALDKIFARANPEKKFKELPKYPSVYRDMSLVVAKDVLSSDIVSSAQGSGTAILSDIKLIDRYSGKQIPDGKISLTYRLEYRDPSRTLEEKDVSLAHSNILRIIEEKYGAKLR